MIRKYAILTLTLLLTDQQANSMPLDTDVVTYDQAGDASQWFIKVSAITKQNSSAPEAVNADQALRAYYKDKADHIGFNESSTFYRCMSKLSHPHNAVRTDKYKSCVNKSLPFRSPVTITVNKTYVEAFYGHALNPGLEMIYKKFESWKSKNI